ncbi:MAG: peptidoglycan-associated lipoprotein Pal [Burkholderiaceae bacterium]|nr:peptidoglycan-associated lipoprotein Pal [Roseateles sp.]MBV8470450.1 peptidoglycan-associated lipoprotein Pal [Burkholderiaceae bacterium]
MKALTTLASMAGAAALLAACSSTPVAPPPPVAEAPKVQAAPPAKPAVAPTPESHVATVMIPPYLDPKNPLSTERSVYFDFDSNVVKSEFTPLLERHGRYLAGAGNVSIKVEGNTDERGGAEYNLALGQRRAEAVIKSLELMGAKNSQLEAVSWGKEKPKAEGHDEAAWSQNRRADLVYPAK